MKNLMLFSAVTATLCLGLAIPVGAAPKTPKAGSEAAASPAASPAAASPAASPAEARPFPFKNTVGAVDKAGRTVSIGKATVHKVHVLPQTKITKANEQPAVFEEIIVGEEIRTVRGDVMLILQRVSDMVEQLSPEVVFGLIAELLHESDASLFQDVHERSAKMMMDILTRGVRRGEIAAAKLSPRLAALPFDLARHQLVLLQQPLSAQDIAEIVDRIFLPLVRAD